LVLVSLVVVGEPSEWLAGHLALLLKLLLLLLLLLLLSCPGSQGHLI
jgi:hypothetical protein